ncbi:hypothetical protein MMC16_007929, partial [Acarospora aff. strigata]|nr:hypothetical protein [Acarospora aff. strigata]
MWVRYAGHFGMPLGNPKFTHATDPSGAGLGLIAKTYVKSIAKVADALHRTKNCDPTLGLGARHYIQHPHVSSWKHVQVLSHPDLVLSANSTDVDAPLVLAPVRDGNPCQLWHQDHWRQFGNSKVTATLGLQDIDHLNKEAFVLINKATKKMLACGSHGEPMGLVDYASGCDGPAVRKLILMEP